jgi:hypothetical protein
MSCPKAAKSSVDFEPSGMGAFMGLTHPEKQEPGTTADWSCLTHLKANRHSFLSVRLPDLNCSAGALPFFRLHLRSGTGSYHQTLTKN